MRLSWHPAAHPLLHAQQQPLAAAARVIRARGTTSAPPRHHLGTTSVLLQPPPALANLVKQKEPLLTKAATPKLGRAAASTPPIK